MRKMTSFYSAFIGGAVLMGLSATASALNVSIGEIVFTEAANPAGSGGFYTVTNNSSGLLTGFGISNSGTQARMNSDLIGTFGCESLYCYEALTVTAANWSTAQVVSYGDPSLTFANVFGPNFSDFVEPGEDTINWFSAVDGELFPGQTSGPSFFGYIGAAPASIGMAYLSDPNGGTPAVLSGVPVTVAGASVPVPGVGWLLGAGLFGVGAMRRRVH